MGCSPTATVDCTALNTVVEEAGTAFEASQTTATCTALVTAAQAAFTGGCPWCEADAEACLEDGSNEDACCDEPSQAEMQNQIDGLTAVCDGYGEPNDDPNDDPEGGMPECWGDCPISVFSSQTGMCESLINGDISCMNDCTGEDAMIVIMLPIICGTCVADGNCDEIDDGE